MGIVSILFIATIFLTGWISALAYQNIAMITGSEQPLSLANIRTLWKSPEQQSPGNHVQEDNIHIFADHVRLDMENAFWSSYADTNSMDPFLDKGANGIEIKPASPKDINAGDIIAFKTELASGIIIHRVIAIGQDERGWYARTKGDNNPAPDPGKVRFEDVTGILVGIIY